MTMMSAAAIFLFVIVAGLLLTIAIIAIWASGRRNHPGGGL